MDGRVVERGGSGRQDWGRGRVGKGGSGEGRVLPRYPQRHCEQEQQDEHGRSPPGVRCTVCDGTLIFATLVSHVDDVVAGKAVATRHFSPTATGLVWGQKTLGSNLTPSLSHPSFPVSFIYRSGENGGITELSVVSLPAVQLRL